VADDETPLIAGRIHGIRVWSIDYRDGSAHLEGVTGRAWVAAGEPTVAKCGERRGRARRRHRAPAPDCGCGLYAVHPHAAGTALAYMSGGSDLGTVAGIVEAWGRVEVHEDGFRAEYARPVAIALVGVPRRSDLGRTAARIARRYRAELIPVEDPEELVSHCRERGLGLSKKVVGSLLEERPRPAADPRPAPAPPTRTPTPTRAAPTQSLLERVGEWVMMGLFGLMALLWYGFLAFAAVTIAISIINGDFGADDEPFSNRNLRVVDQALTLVWGDLRYVAVVRNTSEERVALAVFARGSVSDRDGREVGELTGRRGGDLRPTLLPGETGVVIDELPGHRGQQLPARLRFATEVVARREAARDIRPPVRLGEPVLDRDRCLLSVAVDARRSARGAGITIVARDAEGEISAAGTVALGPTAISHGRRVVELDDSGNCPDWLRSVETYPAISSADLGIRR